MRSTSVAVLGTGPSGLAAAKALLEHGLQPVVFEASAHFGGMWDGQNGAAWSDFARTNISRYSGAFSDFAWPPDSDVFPVRRDLLHYLEIYADSFDLLRHVRFGTRVESVALVGGNRWQLGLRDAGGFASAVFDYVVIGSGFFAQPFRPSFPGLANFSGQVLHSKDCRSAAALRSAFAGKRVLVVGAAFSGTEIAAELANYARVTVTFRRPSWFVPRWVQAVDGGPHYPLDLVIYNRRDDNPWQRDLFAFLGRVGGDPSVASPELALDRDGEPPTAIIISDEFLDLVRDNELAVKRSASLRFNAGGVVYHDGTSQELEAAILCTGFRSSLPFFDRTILDTIQFDAIDQLQPKLLSQNVFHPDLPGLFFVGHYRGPHFAVMELQSRWIARILAVELPMPDRATMLAGVAEELAIRTRVPRPQFPYSDLVGVADGLARKIGVYPALADNDALRERVMRGPMVPAQYRLVGPHAKPEPARAQITETPAPGFDEPRARRPLLGRRILELLHGSWAIERQIEPGGHFTGTATFIRRSSDRLVYREHGQLTLDNGTQLHGENSYVYALRNGAIEISFGGGQNKGEHFIDLALPDDQPIGLPIVCMDRHHCRKDIYDATFHIESPSLFMLTYAVEGPAKAYVSRSTYRRLDVSQ
jgi:dimethylaniline monooxygenase (N-oxide forming)